MIEIKECTKKANIPCDYRLESRHHPRCQAPPEVDCHYAKLLEEDDITKRLLKTYLLLGTIYREGANGHGRN
jgi:hypothetical protein